MKFQLTNRDMERILQRLRQQQNVQSSSKKPRITNLGVGRNRSALLSEFRLDSTSPVGFLWQGQIPVPNAIQQEYIPFLQTQINQFLSQYLAQSNAPIARATLPAILHGHFLMNFGLSLDEVNAIDFAPLINQYFASSQAGPAAPNGGPNSGTNAQPNGGSNGQPNGGGGVGPEQFWAALSGIAGAHGDLQSVVSGLADNHSELQSAVTTGFRNVNHRMDGVDERMDGVDGRMDEGFANANQRVDNLDRRFGEQRQLSQRQLDQLRQELQQGLQGVNESISHSVSQTTRRLRREMHQIARETQDGVREQLDERFQANADTDTPQDDAVDAESVLSVHSADDSEDDDEDRPVAIAQPVGDTVQNHGYPSVFFYPQDSHDPVMYYLSSANPFDHNGATASNGTNNDDDEEEDRKPAAKPSATEEENEENSPPDTFYDAQQEQQQSPQHVPSVASMPPLHERGSPIKSPPDKTRRF